MIVELLKHYNGFAPGKQFTLMGRGEAKILVARGMAVIHDDNGNDIGVSGVTGHGAANTVGREESGGTTGRGHVAQQRVNAANPRRSRTGRA